ncbi:ABC-type transport auxiliary lipoprotein family protein [Salinarimonas chemoclinalis]|uniref:ABC-type transport auxiliary lipoprotein family protein n=1 Tax=Salinarimonas chemoclinalis TaxID=3241599 RepID=UPI0035572CBC
MSETRHGGRGRILAAALALGSVAVLGGCASAPALVTYGLAAPVERVSAPMRLPGLVLVVEPSAIELYSTERVVVREPDGALSYLPGVQYADQLPALVQTRLVETFENASRHGGVARPGDRVTPDWQLNSSIRTFWIDVDTRQAVVEIAVRAVAEANGRVGAARVFTARVPVAAIEGRAAMQALEAALAEVMLDIVRFAGTGGGNA